MLRPNIPLALYVRSLRPHPSPISEFIPRCGAPCYSLLEHCVPTTQVSTYKLLWLSLVLCVRPTHFAILITFMGTLAAWHLLSSHYTIWSRVYKLNVLPKYKISNTLALDFICSTVPKEIHISLIKKGVQKHEQKRKKFTSEFKK